MRSQDAAPMRRADRRPVQIFQHASIVLAGMASIGLTVAAGSYITNQMVDTGRHLPATAPDAATAAPAPSGGTGLRPEDPADPQGSGGRDIAGAITPVLTAVELPALRLPAGPAPAVAPTTAVAAPIAPATPAEPQSARSTGPAGLEGRLPLLGGAYLGANLATEQPDTYSMTVDTNVFSVLGTLFTERHGTPSDGNTHTGSVTRLDTDVDVKSGEVTLAVSDPAVGRRDVTVRRHSDPGSIGEHPHTAATARDGGSVPLTATGPAGRSSATAAPVESGTAPTEPEVTQRTEGAPVRPVQTVADRFVPMPGPGPVAG